MANTDPEGAGGAPRGDGDPGSIRRFADWMRSTLADALSESAAMVRLASSEVSCGWTDSAGGALRERIDSGASGLDDLRGDIGSIAKGLDDYANKLEEAQGKIDTARGIVRASNLDGGDLGVVWPPKPPSAYDPEYDHVVPPDEDTHRRNVEDFLEVYKLAKEARELIEPPASYMDNLQKEISEKSLFVSGDFITARGKELAELYEKRLYDVKLDMDSHVKRHLDAARKALSSPGWKWTRQLLASPHRAGVGVGKVLSTSALKAAQGMGFLGRFCRVAGPGLMLVSIGIDLGNGKPAKKVVVSTMFSLTGMAIACALFPGPGWLACLAITVGGAGFGALGDYISGLPDGGGPVIIDDGWAYQLG